MSPRRTPLAIVGPTASGKTGLSLILARRLSGEIISADSRQIYKYLSVGTSKPTDVERSVVPHHMIDMLDPREPMSAGLFGQRARKILADIEKRGNTPILVGGSGLYIKAVIDGLFDSPGSDPGIRVALEKRFEESGIPGLLDDLRRVDPRTAGEMQMEPKARRIQRALEVYYATGVPLSAHVDKQKKEKPLRCIQIAPRWSRGDLYRRINERVDAMMNAGFLEEVRWLRGNDYGPDLNSLNTVGYKELFAHLNGVYQLPTAVELIKRNTRRFAKRQETWFKGDSRIHWVKMKYPLDWEEVAEEVEKVYDHFQ